MPNIKLMHLDTFKFFNVDTMIFNADFDNASIMSHDDVLELGNIPSSYIRYYFMKKLIKIYPSTTLKEEFLKDYDKVKSLKNFEVTEDNIRFVRENISTLPKTKHYMFIEMNIKNKKRENYREFFDREIADFGIDIGRIYFQK